jgi:hypothetical protein
VLFRSRTGLAKGKTPFAVEMQLLKRIPEKYLVPHYIELFDIEYNKINTDNTETNESSQSTQNNIIVHNKENEIAQVEQTNIKPEVAKPTVPAAKLNGLARSVINLKFGRK